MVNERGENVAHVMNWTDVTIMQSINGFQAVKPAFAVTIEEIMISLDGRGETFSRSKMTVYRRLKGLSDDGYIAKGIKKNHADTFYILEKGMEYIREELTE